MREREREMDCFHVNEKRDGPLLLFSSSTTRGRERWIASSSSSTWGRGLQLLHERDDSFFFFHMRPRICLPHESLKHRILLLMLQIDGQTRAMWRYGSKQIAHLSGSTAATTSCASSTTQHPNSTTCPSSTITSLSENSGMPGKWTGEKANQEWAQHLGIS